MGYRKSRMSKSVLTLCGEGWSAPLLTCELYERYVVWIDCVGDLPNEVLEVLVDLEVEINAADCR
jgi:hypothetical protein